MTVPRLIGVVYHDERRRMEMFIDKPERGQSIKIESFSFIRATSGHAPHVNINHRSMFSDRQEFASRSHPNEYGGPENVFYYTDLAGLNQIWSDSAICPSHSRYGMSSRKYIYCVPVTIWEDDCPASPYHLYSEQYKDRIDIQITIDFRMVKKDRIKSYLTSKGFVAIDCQFLGNLYVKAILGMRTGQFWYIR